MSSSPPLPMRGLSENLGRGALLPSCPPQMKLVYCELTAQTHKHCHITPRLTAASPEPLALSVPKLQAADPPPPWSEQHVYSLCIEAAGSNCLRRGWQVGRRNGSGDRQAAASLPLHVRGSQVLWIPPLHPEVVRSAAGCTATSRPGPLQSLLTKFSLLFRSLPPQLIPPVQPLWTTSCTFFISVQTPAVPSSPWICPP